MSKQWTVALTNNICIEDCLWTFPLNLKFCTQQWQKLWTPIDHSPKSGMLRMYFQIEEDSLWMNIENGNVQTILNLGTKIKKRIVLTSKKGSI